MVMSAFFYFLEQYKRRQGSPVATRRECNLVVQVKDWRSEHIIPREVFWSEKLNSCLIFTSRVFPASSDWATNYIEKNKLSNYSIIEAETLALLDLNKPSTEILSKTYHYNNLDEYLENREKWKDWEADFLQQVQQYR